MKAKIDLVSIFTKNFDKMLLFYHHIMEFEIETRLENYVEFKMEGVRFAICKLEVMQKTINHPSYHDEFNGQPFSLAFPVDSPPDVDTVFKQLVGNGAQSIQPPADMPWNQRTAYFADPDGHIHEIFADLNRKE